MASEPVAPKVFISYSWTSNEHVEWVADLADRLVLEGIDVVLDQWDLKAGHDKHVFMERMVNDPTVNKVLILCDRMYAEKADGRQGGVGTETLIISPEVYGSMNQEKFIPIIRERDEDGKECVPTYLRGRMYIDFCDGADFEESYGLLTLSIVGKRERVKPPLGKLPDHLVSDDVVPPKTRATLLRLKEAFARGKGNIHALLDEFFDAFVEGMQDFRLEPESGSKFDETVIASVDKFTAYRDGLVDLMILTGGHHPDDVEITNQIASFLERLAPFQENPAYPGTYSYNQFDNFRFMFYELVVYIVACLIKTRAYAAAARLLEREYISRQRFGDSKFVKSGIAAFNIPMDSLEIQRKQRLRLSTVTVAGDLVRQRATHPRVTFEDLIQADFVLFVHGAFGEDRQIAWQPRAALFCDGTIELFAKASSFAGREPLETLLGIDSMQEFVDALEVPHTAGTLRNMIGRFPPRKFNLETALNFDEIQSRL